MKRVCLEPGCPELVTTRRCSKHTPNRGGNAGWDGRRDRATQAKFRKAVIQMYGGQCAAILEDGRRCTETHVEAHHTVPGLDDPSTGVCLCKACHSAIERA